MATASELWKSGALLILGIAASVSSAAYAQSNPSKTTTPPAAITAIAAIPATVDLRPRFAEAGLEVRAQGGRNTCSVFAVAGALEFALARRDRTGTRLSVEFLNWASNAVTGEQDDGSFFSDLWKGYEAYGVCDERDEPYREKFDPQFRPGEDVLKIAAERKTAGLCLHWIKPWNVATGLAAGEFDEIKRVLAGGWPVCGGLRWPKQERWTEGVLDMAPPEGVFDGHSVLLAGYRDDAALPGGGVFLIRNSGKGPRDAGLSYEIARAYMNDAAWIECEPARPKSGEAAARPPGSAGDVSAAAREAELDLSLLNPLGPPVIGRNRRVSSNEQPEWHSANLDMNWLMPGESVNMPLLEGPGVITHIWMTSHAGWAGELNALVLRIYYDGRETPGVEVPLGDFFAVGQGKPASVESIPVQVSPSGSLSCFWRMPFRKSARIVVTNDNPDRSTGLYWQVDWAQTPEIPANTPYFYAKFRREYPAVAGRDYTIADLTGRGLYVGTVFSVTMAQDGWFGEGDDFFYIDGETTPSLQGTGSEDYFNDAWGFRVRTGPWFGQPRWQGEAAGDSAVCYRWHLADPIYFTQSLLFAIEHKGNRAEDTDGFYLERPDFISSVAFWYQLGEPKPFGELPPWHERRVPWRGYHLVQAFQQAKATGEAKPQVQTTGFFGARPTLLWPNQTPGAVLEFPFDVEQEGRYALRLAAGNGPGYGAYDIEIDGAKALTADFRAAEGAEADVLLGTRALTAGPHMLGLRAVAAAERVGPLEVEVLRLLRLPPEARRTVRTRNEAHFIRLGIGRAVYAYRLAYGKLPDSLETLVQSGIMPEMYLRDENGAALRQRVEGGYFIVESPGQPGWTHRWQGLDARR
jgi:hypothetical protein